MQKNCEMPGSKMLVSKVLFLPLESLDTFYQFSMCFSPPAMCWDYLFCRTGYVFVLCMASAQLSPRWGLSMLQ